MSSADSDAGSHRRAGVVLHPTSLPGSGPRGSIGAHGRRFVDWLASAGFGIWQVLPLGPTHDNLSPYQCQSAFAGDPSLIDRDDPVAEGWLPAPRWELSIADWLSYARPHYETMLRREALAGPSLGAEIAVFVEFSVARQEFSGLPWWEWPAKLRDREPEALQTLAETRADAMADARFGQSLFDQQWLALKAYANERDIQIMGDAPIFVAQDSAEVWAEREQFLLNKDGQPNVVAGVPPDYFSETGQRWGNPLYDWDVMQRDGFSWWLRRLRNDLRRFDILRIDHFRGLEAYWAIAPECETALTGEWRPAPGDALLTRVRDELGALPLVAEDLGIITPEVDALREAHALPSMKVLQFAFGGDTENPYLPHNHTRSCVVYTGTHDNDTTVGWVHTLEPDTLEQACEYFDCVPFGLATAMMRAAYYSVAETAMLPMQDLLWLDGNHRMNVPGEPEGNWRWRLQWDMVPDGRDRELRRLAKSSGRLVEQVTEAEIAGAPATETAGTRACRSGDIAHGPSVKTVG